MARSEAAHDTRTTPLALDLWTADPPDLDARIANWLAEPGPISARLRALTGDETRLRVGPQGLATLGAEPRLLLGVTTDNCFVREIELLARREPCLYAQTLVPDSTLRAYPWLAELGDSPLGDMLAALSGVTRSTFEYADLPPAHPLAARAQRDVPPGAQVTLPARRATITVRGHALLVQDVFLPALLAHAVA